MEITRTHCKHIMSIKRAPSIHCVRTPLSSGMNSDQNRSSTYEIRAIDLISQASVSTSRERRSRGGAGKPACDSSSAPGVRLAKDYSTIFYYCGIDAYNRTLETN